MSSMTCHKAPLFITGGLSSTVATEDLKAVPVVAIGTIRLAHPTSGFEAVWPRV